MKPRLMPGVTLQPPETDSDGYTRYYIENLEGDCFEVSEDLYEDLTLSDGCHALSELRSDKKLLRELKGKQIVTTSRFERFGIFNGFILFPIGEIPKHIRAVCRVLNRMLPLLSVAIFLLGLLTHWLIPVRQESWFDLLLYIGLLVFSVAAHEFGHFVSEAAYNAKVKSVGILLFLIIPVGAYVYCETGGCNLNEKQKAQISLSGVEMNLLVAGCFLAIGKLYQPLYSTMISAANFSMAMFLFNLLPSEMLDGEAALSALFGVDSISRVARRVFRDPTAVHDLHSSGLAGRVCLGAFGLTYLAKIVAILCTIGSLVLNAYLCLI